jgi:hypothetical protein
LPWRIPRAYLGEDVVFLARRPASSSLPREKKNFPVMFSSTTATVVARFCKRKARHALRRTCREFRARISEFGPGTLFLCILSNKTLRECEEMAEVWELVEFQALRAVLARRPIWQFKSRREDPDSVETTYTCVILSPCDPHEPLVLTAAELRERIAQQGWREWRASEPFVLCHRWSAVNACD